MNGPPNRQIRPGGPAPGSPGYVSKERDLGELFTSGLGTLVNYAHLRGILVLIELREAGVQVGRKVGLMAAAALFIAIGYFGLLFSLMALVVAKTGWGWAMTIAVFGCAHVTLGIVAFIIANKYPKVELFRDTINELEKDRVWLNQKDPSKN